MYLESKHIVWSHRWWGLLLAPLLIGSAEIGGGSPEAVVARYLSALQHRDFALAHPHLTDDMTGGKDAFAWAVEQNIVFKHAGVVIHGFNVFAAKIEADTAFVPNILHSQDDLVNRLGADEYELYRLQKTGGRWRIERQKVLSKPQRADWFEKSVDVSAYINERPTNDDDPWSELE
ncbi:MAG: hypothetical protein VCB07_11000 [Gammaproteobacteria bacterium]